MIRSPLPTLLVAAALTAGCASSPSEEERFAEVYNRIAFLMGHYNSALQRQDETALGLATGDLRRLANEHFEIIVQGLSSGDVQDRTFSAFALGFASQRAAIDPLARATEDEAPSVRANAIASLGLIGFDDVPVEPFRKLLDDPDPAVRQAALFGLRPLLGPSNDRGLLEAIHRKLADPEWGVRKEALILLQKIRKKESVAPILANSVKDPEPDVRAQAATTLGSHGRDALEANPYLIEMLRDDYPKVVERACAALNSINEKGFDRIYNTWRDWYEEELKHHYLCPDHPETRHSAPGQCPKCGKVLERTPNLAAKRSDGSGPSFVCPDHPEVVTSSPARCGKAGCGKTLVPRTAEKAQAFVCPDHPEVLTTSPSKCGKQGCGKELVPKK